MKRTISYYKAPRKRVSFFLFQFLFLHILPSSIYAADEHQPKLYPSNSVETFNIQVAGSQININNDNVQSFEMRDTYLWKNVIRAEYRCRTYQGAINKVSIQTKNGEEIISTRHYSYGGGSRAGQREVHTWNGLPVTRLSTIINKCRNKTDNQILEVPIRLWNTCGRNEGHTRNGGSKIRLLLQCSPSEIAPVVKPILWRYECNGPNMFIDGTSKKFVEKRTDSDRVMCVYRAPVPGIKRR